MTFTIEWLENTYANLPLTSTSITLTVFIDLSYKETVQTHPAVLCYGTAVEEFHTNQLCYHWKLISGPHLDVWHVYSTDGHSATEHAVMQSWMTFVVSASNSQCFIFQSFDCRIQENKDLKYSKKRSPLRKRRDLEISELTQKY